MAALDSNANSPKWLLTGEVDGDELRFELAAGEYRLGSSRASDLCLPVKGVSRQHAVLEVSAGGLVVEDRGSKNGTLVDGRRVERAGASAGSQLGFGPVQLTVVAVDSDDVELALVVDLDPPDPHPTPTTRFSRWETTALLAGQEALVPAVWLDLVEGFMERLTAAAPGDFGPALSFLVEGLGAASGCAVEWVDQEPVVLGAWGETHEIPAIREIENPPARDHQPVLSCASLKASDATTLSLFVWGEFVGHAHSAPLLRAALRCLDPRRQPALRDDLPAADSRRGLPELVFPTDYRPGSSPAMTDLYRQMQPLLAADLPVLITGETGVGKERLARILHDSSDRRGGPFLAVNCAAIPADLLEAEMFGIGRGVATGVDARDGKFQQAEGGSLFLDEVGEMLPALQAKLLRSLQEKEVQPLGGQPRQIDVRILAATNADLHQRIETGSFRRDLYYRLAGYALQIPALRDCRDDLPALVEHFLRRFSAETGKQIRGITVKALRVLTYYGWPGNVRELEHEVRRLVYRVHDGGVIDAGMLSRPLLDSARPAAAPPAAIEPLALEPALRELEERLIREALRRAARRQVEAARLLGISRNGLANKMKRFGIPSRREATA